MIIWTPMSSIKKRADKLNLSFSLSLSLCPSPLSPSPLSPSLPPPLSLPLYLCHPYASITKTLKKYMQPCCTLRVHAIPMSEVARNVLDEYVTCCCWFCIVYFIITTIINTHHYYPISYLMTHSVTVWWLWLINNTLQRLLWGIPNDFLALNPGKRMGA